MSSTKIINLAKLKFNYNITNATENLKTYSFYQTLKFINIFNLRTFLYFDQVHDFIEGASRTKNLTDSDRKMLNTYLQLNYKKSIEFYSKKIFNSNDFNKTNFNINYKDLSFNEKTITFQDFYKKITTSDLEKKTIRDNIALELLHIRGIYKLNLYDNIIDKTKWNCNYDNEYLSEFLRQTSSIKNSNINSDYSLITVDAHQSKFNLSSIIRKLCTDFTSNGSHVNYFYKNLPTLYDSASNSSINKFVSHYREFKPNNFKIISQTKNLDKFKVIYDDEILLEYEYIYINGETKLKIDRFFELLYTADNINLPTNILSSKDGSVSKIIDMLNYLNKTSTSQEPNANIYIMAFKTIGDFGQIIDFYYYSNYGIHLIFNKKTVSGAKEIKFSDIPFKIFVTHDINCAYISSMFNYGTVLESLSDEFTFPITLFTNKYRKISEPELIALSGLQELSEQNFLTASIKFVLNAAPGPVKRKRSDFGKNKKHVSIQDKINLLKKYSVKINKNINIKKINEKLKQVKRIHNIAKLKKIRITKIIKYNDSYKRVYKSPSELIKEIKYK